MPNHWMTSPGSLERSTLNRAAAVLSLLLSLSACSSGPSRYALRQDRAPGQDFNGKRIANAVPREEPRSKYGNKPSYVVMGKRYQVMTKADGFKQRGIASWYGKKFHGYRTSSGEIYNMYRMTAAHKNLPLPSYVYVTNLDNGRRVIVRVNDRGPFHANRIIDLSYAAAKKLGITGKGTGRVEISYIDPREYHQKRSRIAAFNQAPPKQAKIAAKESAQKNTAKAQAKQTKVLPKQQALEQTAVRQTNQVYIQVGAFANRSNADQMRSKIETLVKQKKVNTGYNIKNKLYRVRIGPLASAQEADRLMEQISRSGIAEPRIIND